MITEEQQDRSQLFTLRVWVEELGDGRREIRGKIKQIPNGGGRILPRVGCYAGFRKAMAGGRGNGRMMIFGQ